MRDNDFLENLLYDLWDNYFCDVPRKNFVLIKFGKYSKRQLGCISLAHNESKIKGLMRKKYDEYIVQDNKSISIITITRYFRNEVVPEYVIKATIAHELCHYTHGFNSPLKKQFSKPHKGNIINKELKKRGLLEEQKLADKWLKENWIKVIS
ncbi:MAG TPA: hypothetical protein PLS56_00275 [Candidatus Dojkabacteria bacterium]|jgi:hypothetical protein|nr:hypothetical protein [Candidatus Dojkabacteria bacterium]